MRKNISPSKAIEDFGKQKKTPANSFNAEIEFYKCNPMMVPQIFKNLTPVAQAQAIKRSKS